MQLRGDWADALAEARQACAHLATPSGDPAVGMAHYQRAELLRLRGALRRLPRRPTARRTGGGIRRNPGSPCSAWPRAGPTTPSPRSAGSPRRPRTTRCGAPASSPPTPRSPSRRATPAPPAPPPTRSRGSRPRSRRRICGPSRQAPTARCSRRRPTAGGLGGAAPRVVGVAAARGALRGGTGAPADGAGRCRARRPRHRRAGTGRRPRRVLPPRGRPDLAAADRLARGTGAAPDRGADRLPGGLTRGRRRCCGSSPPAPPTADRRRPGHQREDRGPAPEQHVRQARRPSRTAATAYAYEHGLAPPPRG